MARQFPRKIPRQERSRRMVENILDATARILATSGYDGASTHRIAAEAGISPGSLYQYFAHKDAVIAATVERMIEQIGAHLIETFETLSADPGTDTVRPIVAAVLDATEQNRELVRVLVEQMPRLGGSDEIKTLERRATDLAFGHLAAPATPHDPATLWMALQALQHITIRYVLDRPAIPRDTFLNELTTLIKTLTLRLHEGGTGSVPAP
ncbi:TetR family transcriptional regulator [Actinocorallia herbida]|uniref:TetR family transcriptional regulator n=1 Tax=Actinocorallia herbida TaxID=58109 RepID=A0A3N1D7U0_9ACTN|nr:TetR/AcrR family transcriptional regulator [Actinocorallia herbida]ROO89566.1 TetR family transcriptional regulator [Actinocorallia herbida]